MPENPISNDSIADKFKTIKEMNAGMVKMVIRDSSGNPTGIAVFAIDDEAKEVLDVITKLEDSWE